MLTWAKTTLLLCFYGFSKEFRPSEPYITRFLTSTEKNLTREEVNQEIYPIGTYANLALLVIVFLVTDILRCKPVIAVQGLAGICTYAIVIGSTSKIVIQFGQMFYGLFIASDTAYHTYMYTVSTEHQYQAASSYTRIGTLLGCFLSGIVSQAVVSLDILGSDNLLFLNYLTLGGMSIAFITALFLPMPPRSMYFHQQTVNEKSSDNDKCIAGFATDNHSNIENGKNPLKNLKRVSPLVAMKRDFIAAYSNLGVVQWSVWWALATCGYYQVTSYIQILWEESLAERGTNETLYSGAVDAIYTIVGTGVLASVGRQRTNLAPVTSLILITCCLVDGALVLTCAATRNMWVHYTFYIVFKVVYHCMMVLASSEVAKGVSSDCHALVFGFNSFLALVLQTVLTVVVASRRGLALPIRTQFWVYGSYFVVMGVLFLVSVAVSAITSRRSSKAKGDPVPVEEDGV